MVYNGKSIHGPKIYRTFIRVIILLINSKLGQDSINSGDISRIEFKWLREKFVILKILRRTTQARPTNKQTLSLSG